VLTPETLSQAKLGSEPIETPPTIDLADELVSALELLRQIVGSQIRTLQIARQLMLAQDLAERHRSRVGPAVDEAAGSDGDPDAIERAVRAVAVADAAAKDEWTLSQEWAEHICQVHRLGELAEELFARSRIALQTDAPDVHVVSRRGSPRGG
jgi:hypothetical protein